MYKWPQGRVTRTIAFVLVLVIVADLGWVGAAANIDTWMGASEHANPRTLAVGIVYAALAAAALIAGIVTIGFKASTVDFLIEVEQEMTKVTWPTVNELIRATIVVAVMIAILGVLIFAVDWFNISVVFEALYGTR